jgi:hypothetical protein
VIFRIFSGACLLIALVGILRWFTRLLSERIRPSVSGEGTPDDNTWRERGRDEC